MQGFLIIQKGANVKNQALSENTSFKRVNQLLEASWPLETTMEATNLHGGGVLHASTPNPTTWPRDSVKDSLTQPHVTRLIRHRTPTDRAPNPCRADGGVKRTIHTLYLLLLLKNQSLYQSDLLVSSPL